MIALSATAQRQLDSLIARYENLDRPEATRNLMIALETVSGKIERGEGRWLPAPAPYLAIARMNLGFRRLRQGASWFAFAGRPEAFVITGVFYVTSDIPNRL